jgi:hypothetical protein
VLYVRLACEIVALCSHILSTNDRPDHLKFASYGPVLQRVFPLFCIDKDLVCSVKTTNLFGHNGETKVPA